MFIFGVVLWVVGGYFLALATIYMFDGWIEVKDLPAGLVGSFMGPFYLLVTFFLWWNQRVDKDKVLFGERGNKAPKKDKSYNSYGEY
jgi:hypothetical protein